jgi:peptidylprolyl isomerase
MPLPGTPASLTGWPVGLDQGRTWPIHCYATVGVARDLSPDTGTGAELYAVIGQPPRQLDRNIAVVGRVIEGIEHLSSLPRAPGNGVYKDAADRTPILSVRLASDLPADQQPHFEYLSTQSASFARYADLRAHRHDDFIKVAANGADICSIPCPSAAIPQADGFSTAPQLTALRKSPASRIKIRIQRSGLSSCIRARMLACMGPH